MPLPRMNPQLAPDAPLLQYSSGKTVMKMAGKANFATTIGFHSEAGKHDAFDRVCRDANIARALIRHQGGEVKEHYYYGETITVLPIMAGPPCASVFALKSKDNATKMAQAGIGARWSTDQNGKPRSQVAVRCFLPVLTKNGAWEPVQLSVSSTMSDYVLKAMADQMRVAHAAAQVLGKPDLFPAEIALPLGPGNEVTVGKTEKMTLVPFVSMHPKEVTAEYIAQVSVPDAASKADAIWDTVVAWATEYTRPDEAAAQPAPAKARDDIYLPQDGAEMETAIGQAKEVEVLEAYRSRLLDLRDRRVIDVPTQVALATAIEDRLDAIADVK